MATETNTVTNATGGISHLKDKLIDYSVDHSGALFSAAAVVVVGFIAARWIGKLANHWLTHKNLEQPIRMLLVRIVRLLIFAMALVVALETVGIKMTAIIAGISITGVGVGLAMQGVLGNLIAGLTIIFTKPFRVGEYIEIAGKHGQVEAIELASTILMHPDRSRVVIPNRKIVGDILHNYGHIRQLDLSVGVAYSTNLNDALLIVRGVLSENPRVLKDPAPVVGVTALGESSINISVKPWTSVADFNPAQAEVYLAIVEKFRANKIEIPFPQREVRLLNQN